MIPSLLQPKLLPAPVHRLRLFGSVHSAATNASWTELTMEIDGWTMEMDSWTTEMVQYSEPYP